MKRLSILILALAFILSACSQAATPAASSSETLVVKSGDGTPVTFTVEQLKALGQAQAAFQDVTYTGVPLADLLKAAGFDPDGISAVKAVAVDGFSANYDASLFTKSDTLVAYARADSPLAEDEVPFRMVVPDQGGKLNPRQLVEIQIIP